MPNLSNDVVAGLSKWYNLKNVGVHFIEGGIEKVTEKELIAIFHKLSTGDKKLLTEYCKVKLQVVRQSSSLSEKVDE